ncbi:MAG: T9SS type A sorting domain-containing protein [Ignavibacteria bacterium]|nr:T9SS type A sorting domain-containing protein [Ignavibacteria bacterium]
MAAEVGTRISALTTVPADFRLEQNYPNPFNPSTSIDYALPRDSNVKLEVFNLIGERVRVLQDGWQNAGYHKVVFRANQLPSGVYTYRIQAGEFVETKKLMLVK